jgi:hypothetical protein
MENGGVFIKNVLIVGAIFGIVFLSQQSFLKPFGRIMYSQGTQQYQAYFAKISTWFKASIYPKINTEAQNRGAAVNEAITAQKQNAAQVVWENIKNYFANTFSKISGTHVK